MGPHFPLLFVGLPEGKYHIMKFAAISHQMTLFVRCEISLSGFAISLANCQLESKAARRPSTSSFATSKEAVFSENLTARIEMCTFFPAEVVKFRLRKEFQVACLNEWSTVDPSISFEVSLGRLSLFGLDSCLHKGALCLPITPQASST